MQAWQVPRSGGLDVALPEFSDAAESSGRRTRAIGTCVGTAFAALPVPACPSDPRLPAGSQIMEHLRHIPPAPSVAFHERAPDTIDSSQLQARGAGLGGREGRVGKGEEWGTLWLAEGGEGEGVLAWRGVEEGGCTLRIGESWPSKRQTLRSARLSRGTKGMRREPSFPPPRLACRPAMQAMHISKHGEGGWREGDAAVHAQHGWRDEALAPGMQHLGVGAAGGRVTGTS